MREFFSILLTIKCNENFHEIIVIRSITIDNNWFLQNYIMTILEWRFILWYLISFLFIFLTRYLDQETVKKPFGHRAKLSCFCQSNHSKDTQANGTCYPKTKQANLPAYLHTITLMLNVKQRSCKYQLFKFYGPTRFTD